MSSVARCFTAEYDRRVNVLMSPCEISQAFSVDTASTGPSDYQSFEAIWDTGATHSVITQAVVDACGLLQTGVKRSHTANGDCDSPSYLVSIKLPSNLIIRSLNVACLKISGTDVLIGMDIISMGDFAISQFAGKTTFSFRCPSQEKIDFNRPSVIGRTSTTPGLLLPSRNAPCPCGSGKKAKRCCI